MTLSNTSGVYGIFCKANGKVYIGGTTRLRIRRGQHFCDLRKGIHCCRGLQKLFTQYGSDGLSFEVIEEVASKDDLDLVEQKWIDFYLEAGTLLNECKIAGTTKGRSRREDERSRISRGLERYHALQFKGARDVARYIEEHGEDGLQVLSIRQLKAIGSLLRVYRYSYKSKAQIIEEILCHRKKGALPEIVRLGKKVEPQPRRSSKPKEKGEPKSWTFWKERFRLKEFLLVSEEAEEFTIISSEALTQFLDVPYSKTLGLINRRQNSVNGFFLVAIIDTVSRAIDYASGIYSYSFESPSGDVLKTIKLAHLTKKKGLNSCLLNQLRSGYCSTNGGWKYIGKTNIFTKEFTPNSRYPENPKSALCA